MPGPQPEQIKLSDKAQHDLEKLAARPTTSQQKAQRARIILKAGEGKNNAEIAREVRQSIDMVRLWVAAALVGTDGDRVGGFERRGAVGRLTTTGCASAVDCQPAMPDGADGV